MDKLGRASSTMARVSPPATLTKAGVLPLVVIPVPACRTPLMLPQRSPRRRSKDSPCDNSTGVAQTSRKFPIHVRILLATGLARRNHQSIRVVITYLRLRFRVTEGWG